MILRFIKYCTIFIFLPVCFISWANSPEVRYERWPKIYQMIWQQEGNVDIVATGSSRSARMFDAIYLENAFQKYDKKLTIYDLSRSFRGMDANFVILRDFLEHRNANHILIEFNVLEHINGMYSHKLLHQLGKFNDFFGNVCFWHKEEQFYTEFHHGLIPNATESSTSFHSIQKEMA